MNRPVAIGIAAITGIALLALLFNQVRLERQVAALDTKLAQQAASGRPDPAFEANRQLAIKLERTERDLALVGQALSNAVRKLNNLDARAQDMPGRRRSFGPVPAVEPYPVAPGQATDSTQRRGWGPEQVIG